MAVRSVAYDRAMRANETRNQKIVELRDSDPKKYSFRELSRIFRLKVSTVHEIYHRDKRKYGGKKGAGALGVVHTRRLASVRS